MVYGGKHVSDFESAEDKLRLPRLGVRVITPLADGEALIESTVDRMLTAGRAATQPFDMVIMTLWFWNTSPVPRDFVAHVRAKSKGSKVVVLSDDVRGVVMAGGRGEGGLDDRQLRPTASEECSPRLASERCQRVALGPLPRERLAPPDRYIIYVWRTQERCRRPAR